MIKIDHLSFETLGNRIHTNRELGMMLRGEKPLAKFSGIRDRFPDVVERYIRLFDRHVASGRFVRRDHFLAIPEISRAEWGESFQTIYFALPNEVWRIDAMIELRSHVGRWKEAQERQEGSLLGYEDWQNDIWIAGEAARRSKGLLGFHDD